MPSAQNLEARICSATMEMQSLQRCIAKAEVAAAQINSEINARKISCATRLQALIRGWRTRHEAAKRRQMAEANARILFCATKLQAVFRGFLGRCKATEQRKLAAFAAKRQIAAATSIQRHWKIYLKRLAKRAKRRRLSRISVHKSRT